MTQQEWDNAWDIYDSCIDAGGVPAHCEGAAQASYPDFTTTGGGGFGGAMTDYWSDPNNWLSFTSGLAGIVGGIVGYTDTGQPIYAGSGYQQQDNTMLWVVAGFGLLFLIILLFIAFKK